MEDAARAIIRNPKMLTPLIAVLFAILVWRVPQLVVLVVAVLMLRRWVRRRRLEALAERVVERHRE